MSSLIKAARMNMLESIDNPDKTTNNLLILTQLQKAYETASNTNVNVRFLLENTFLQL